MTAYDLYGSILSETTFPFNPEDSFAGLAHPEIHKVVIHSPSGDAYNIDDFIFEGLTIPPRPPRVPEFSTSSLLITSIITALYIIFKKRFGNVSNVKT